MTDKYKLNIKTLMKAQSMTYTVYVTLRKTLNNLQCSLSPQTVLWFCLGIKSWNTSGENPACFSGLPHSCTVMLV